MYRVVGVTELQRRFKSIFDRVAEEKVPYVLTRGSRPEAALVPYEQFLRFQALQEQEVLARFDQLVSRMADKNASFSEDEIAADISAARAELSGR